MSAILIVDDHEQNRYLLRAMLAASGAEVLEAANGAEALELARRARPDLIISDILMPQMDGFALCRECKRDEHLRDIPFVFYTATYTDPRDEALALQLGAARFVIKPVESEDFIAIVREVLQAHAAGQLAAPPPPLEEETAFYRLYNEALIRKLEDKMLDLERLNHKLAESEARFESMIRNAADMIVALDAEGLIRYASPACKRILGYEPQEVIGRNFLEWVHPDDLTEAQAAFASRRQTPGAAPAPVEVRGRHKDGSWRALEAVGTNLLDDPSVRALVINVRDITERKQRERELEAIAAVSAALRVAQTRAEMLPLILEQLTGLLKADGAAIATHDPASGETLIELAHGDWGKWTGIRLQPGEGISGYVIDTGQPYINNDVRNDPRMTHPDLLSDVRAVACVPLVTRGQTIGAIWAGRKTGFAAEEVHLLTAISDMAANAIHRAALHEETVRRVEQLQALQTIDRAITASLDLRISLNVVLEQTLAQLRAAAVGVLLYDPHALSLNYAAGRGFRARNYEHSRVRLGEGQAGRAALEQRVIHVANIARCDPPFVRLPLLTNEGFVSYAVAPLISKGQLKGMLEVFHRNPFQPGGEWLNFLEALARQAAIAIDNAQLFDSLQQSNLELSLAYDTTIEGWSRALDLRDKETEGHTLRVTEMTLRLARVAGMTEDEIVHVRRGALLHDIGKMGVPDSILLKPGKLTDEEWVAMRKHPTYAYELLLPIAYLRPALDIPYCHHEKWDGSGYPRGLKGEQIPLAARLFAVVDVWDALRSDRPYRQGWPEEKVFEYIKAGSGTHFDPNAVELFLRVMNEDTLGAG